MLDFYGGHDLSRRDRMLVENVNPNEYYCPVGTRCDRVFPISSLRDEIVVCGRFFYQYPVPNGTKIMTMLF